MITFSPPPESKFKLKKSVLLSVSALLSLSCTSAFSADFFLNKENPWTNGNNAYFITSEKSGSLSDHSLKVDGDGYNWGENPFKYVALIHIDKSKEREFIEGIDNISHNIISISNISDSTTNNQRINSVYGIYLTPIKNTSISDNEITISNVNSRDILAIEVARINQTSTVNGQLPQIGSENINLTSNTINILNSNTSGIQAITVGAGSGEISSNIINIFGNSSDSGTIGISATNLYSTSGDQITQSGSFKITDNEISIQDSSFRYLAGVSVSSSPYGEIRGNSLKLTGNNVFNPRYSGKNAYIFGVFSGSLGTSASDKTSPEANIYETKVSISGTLTVNYNGWRQASIGGAKSLSGTVSGNSITLNQLDLNIDSRISLSIYGGYSGQEGYALETAGARADHNSVQIISVNEDWSEFGINTPQIYGGYSEIQNSLSNSVSLDNSTLVFSNSATSSITGGYAELDSEQNTVSLTNSSKVIGNIVGSYSEKGGQLSSRITIEDSTVIGDISLFEVDRKVENESYGKDSNLIISGVKTDLSQANLFVTQSSAVQTTNNSLIINGWTGSIGSLGTVTDNGSALGFDHLSISGVAWTDGSVLISSLADPSNKQYTVFDKNSIDDTSFMFTNAPSLVKNEKVIILKAENDITYTDPSDTTTEKQVQGNAGTATVFDGKVTFEKDQIVYSIENVERAPQTTLLGDSRIAAVAFVNQSNDLLAHVFDTFLYDQNYGLATFASAEGNKSQYDVNSSLKINGWNFMAGLRYKERLNSGDWTTAIFYENGEGNYRTWNEHLGHRFKTNGDLTYNGLGLATRVMNDSGLYAEASAQFGQIKIDMGNALMDTLGNSWDFNSRSNYFGTHIGLGWLIPITSNVKVDLFGKYFYSHTTSDTFRVNAEKYEFSDIDSQRLQLEGKINYSRDNVTLYAGLGAEYEFDGESSMKAASTPEFVSDLDGLTGIAEIGFRLTPSQSSPWLFQANVKGWEGQRDGISGTATIQYYF